jgi:hypothetical protein
VTDELNRLLYEAWEYNITNIHTSFPGKVVSYNQKTRRADIQPSLKRRLPNGSFVDFPILPDVPIQFPGSSEYTIHFPLKKDDEVEVRVCERSTDVWRDSGDKGIEDPDPRRFNLSDCYATPGLQPAHFIPTEEKGLAIIHHAKWDGDFISSVAMDDDKIEVLYKDISRAIFEDEDITVKYKEKCQAKMEDDHLTANTEKCTVDMTADVMTAKNSQITAKLNASKASVNNGGKDLFTIINKFMSDIIASEFVGSPAQHVISPPDIVKLKQDQADFGQIMEAG